MNNITLQDQDTFMCLAADILKLVDKFGAEHTMQLIDLAFDIHLVMDLDYKAKPGSDFAQTFLTAMREQAVAESPEQMMERLNG
jgi:hypothetical protein